MQPRTCSRQPRTLSRTLCRGKSRNDAPLPARQSAVESRPERSGRRKEARSRRARTRTHPAPSGRKTVERISKGWCTRSPSPVRMTEKSRWRWPWPCPSSIACNLEPALVFRRDKEARNLLSAGFLPTILFAFRRSFQWPSCVWQTQHCRRLRRDTWKLRCVRSNLPCGSGGSSFRLSHGRGRRGGCTPSSFLVRGFGSEQTELRARMPCWSTLPPPSRRCSRNLGSVRLWSARREGWSNLLHAQLPEKHKTIFKFYEMFGIFLNEVNSWNLHLKCKCIKLF